VGAAIAPLAPLERAEVSVPVTWIHNLDGVVRNECTNTN